MPTRNTIRHYLSLIWNKQFLIFLFFLTLSTIFWLFQKLDETYEEDFFVPIELQGVPSNVVITTDLPTHLRVSLKDKGNTLLAYHYARPIRPVIIDFNSVSGQAGHIMIKGNELTRQISSQTLPSTQLVGIKPDTLEIYYNYGLCKRVPVVVQGEVNPARLYALSHTVTSSDSVTVYASRERLDTITAAYTTPVNLRNLNDTTRVKATFAKVRGAKFVPSDVDITFCIDRVVEKSVRVPVKQVNFPASKQLRTFPAAVNVTFQVSMGLYRRITSENFVLVVNYEDLLKNRSNRCRLSLKTIPAGVSHVRITPADVEYIIEDIPDYEVDNEGL